MKAIILAAGEGKRMRPLTLVRPKPMIEVLGKPLLHHIIDSLPSEITELIIVIGYKGGAIKAYFGDQFEGRSVKYIVQEKQLGNAHALGLCRDLLKPSERFLFLFADDLHSPQAIKRLLQKDIGMLVQEHSDPKRFGVVETDASGRVISIEEKPKQPKTNLVAVGVYVLDTRIFDYQASLHESGEYYMTDQISQLVTEHKFVIEKTEFWHPVGYPHDIDAAEKLLNKETSVVRSALPVILIAGGKGTRMPEDEKHLPKCLVGIAGKPMLQWQIEYLHNQGFFNITLSLGYKAELVVEWLKQNKHTDIKYAIEIEPLGTGGGIKLALEGTREPFIAINCDDLADVNLAALIRHSGGNAYNVLSIIEIDDARMFGLIDCDDQKKICEFKEKDPNSKKGLVSIGHYYLQADVFDGFSKAFSIEKDVFPKLASTGKLVAQQHKGEYWVTANDAEQLKNTREHFSKFRK